MAGVNRAEIIDQNFLNFVQTYLPVTSERPASDFALQAVGLFESQMISRHLDFAARNLKKDNQSFYTIGSSGHEGNVALGFHLRTTDPLLLHYRSGALMAERVKKDPEQNFIFDTLLSLCASKDDPVSGGRHKVWGNKKLWVLPQTSTIASQLPKAVGMSMALERAKHLKLPLPIPTDSIVCVSFGDASVNHSTAVGAINAAQWVSYQNLPLPILFVCEDNGIGISVKTPKNYVASQYADRVSLDYFYANGLDLEHSFEVVQQAVEHCRQKRRPTFLHLKTVRLMGHAGSDVETEYLSIEEIQAQEKLDPLLVTAKWVMDHGVMHAEKIKNLYENIRQRVTAEASKAIVRPKLSSAQSVVASLVVEGSEHQVPSAFAVQPVSKPRHMAALINLSLEDILSSDPHAVVFGEDVAKKGGVYHVTTGLYEKFGAGRVFNTLLDEQTILGLAIGLGSLGFHPIPEIQYLAYYHNAQDQIRGEAASTSFFSNGQFQNGMVIRVASFAYQKGFGGHFHNDNAIGALRDVPGVMIATPSRGDDAAAMLKTCHEISKTGRVVFFLEPIALYMTKDLFEPGDGLWQFVYPNQPLKYGDVGVYEPTAKEIVILTYANGVPMSLQAAQIMKKTQGLEVKVVDLRWLKPLPEEAILREVGDCKKVLLVDECRRTGGGVWEALSALLHEHKKDIKVQQVTALDTFIPLGGAANLVLPQVEDIVSALGRWV